MTDTVTNLRGRVYGYDSMIRQGIVDGSIMTKMEEEMAAIVSGKTRKMVFY